MISIAADARDGEAKSSTGRMTVRASIISADNHWASPCPSSVNNTTPSGEAADDELLNGTSTALTTHRVASAMGVCLPLLLALWAARMTDAATLVSGAAATDASGVLVGAGD